MDTLFVAMEISSTPMERIMDAMEAKTQAMEAINGAMWRVF